MFNVKNIVYIVVIIMKNFVLKTVVLSLTFVLIMICISGCQSKNKTDSKDTQSTESSQEKSNDNKSTQEFYSSDDEVFEINTDYAVLKYPSEYKEIVKTSVTNENPYTISFTTEINKTDIKLFDIVFGGSDGYKLGTLKKDGKSIEVYTVDYSANFSTELSDEEMNTLNTLTQKINVVISNLIKDYDFKVSG